MVQPAVTRKLWYALCVFVRRFQPIGIVLFGVLMRAPPPALWAPFIALPSGLLTLPTLIRQGL
jgi:hypothetical protein